MAGSLVVRQAGSEDHLQIDQATAAALELIHPIRVGTSSGRRSGMSLFRCCWVLASWVLASWVLGAAHSSVLRSGQHPRPSCV